MSGLAKLTTLLDQSNPAFPVRRLSQSVIALIHFRRSAPYLKMRQENRSRLKMRISPRHPYLADDR